jgi:peptidoglycan/LPS O-acetylase OafA/YrhL
VLPSSPSRDSTTQPYSSSPTRYSGQIKRDSPNHDFYNNCYSFPPLIYAFFVMVMMLGIKYTVIQYAPTDPLQLCSLPYIYISVLAATVVCRRKPESRKMRIIVSACCFIVYVAFVGYGTFFFELGVFLLCSAPTCLAFIIADERKIWRAKRLAP